MNFPASFAAEAWEDTGPRMDDWKWRAVAAAGPLVEGAFGVVLLLLLQGTPLDVLAAPPLASAIVNLLPLPGSDGSLLLGLTGLWAKTADYSVLADTRIPHSARARVAVYTLRSKMFGTVEPYSLDYEGARALREFPGDIP
jgi:hypothetical protein